MKKSHRKHDRLVRHLIFGLSLFLAIPFSVSLATAVTPITPSGLNTTVSGPITLPSGQTQFNITGGTRPGGGVNLFHSFGDFNVPNNNIANFLNNSALPTSNILGRVTGGNISNIFGTVQTTGFGNANLFLMNPTGFLFGPNAMVNVGGMVTFTSADYLRLSDNARFNAVPHTAPDLLLSAAPVAAFGFLGSNPGAITVQGSHLSVAEGTGIALVGGNITMQPGTLDNGTVQSAQLSAPSGQINLVSVGKPSKGGGEVVVGGAGQGAGFLPTGFKSLGTINLSQGSSIDSSAIASGGNVAGSVLIRGGQLIMDASSIQAGNSARPLPFTKIGGNIEVTAEQVALSNHSSIATTSTAPGFKAGGTNGNITINVKTFSATDSTISSSGVGQQVTPGSLTIQGLQGSGTSADAVSLTTSQLLANGGDTGTQSVNGGPITIRANNISLNQTGLSTISEDGLAGVITLTSRDSLQILNSSLSTRGIFVAGGTVDLKAGSVIDLIGTTISSGVPFFGGTITMSAPIISIIGSSLDVFGGAHGGTVSLTGTKAVSLTNTTISGNRFITSTPNGGIININGGANFTSQQSTIALNGGTIHIDANKVGLTDTQVTTSVSGGPQTVGGNITINGNKVTLDNSQVLSTATEGHGGTIHIDANKVGLTDTQVTTSVSGGPQSIGGNITIDGNKVTLDNSQVLSTATEGHGGTIGITTHKLNSTNSVIDATSQFGTDGTVTIERP